MTERALRLSRRKFLLTAGAGGVTAAAAIVAKNTAPSQSPENKDKRSTRGYHASEHVNNYYRTTKV